MSFKLVESSISEITRECELKGTFFVDIRYVCDYSIAKSFNADELKSLKPLRIDGADSGKNATYLNKYLEVYFKEKAQAISFLIMALEVLSRFDDIETKI
jgi:hypothetical protein